MTAIAADVRSLDPTAYAAAIGLVPDDCYGFLPIDHDDITPYLFLYRDRAQYAQARASLPAPQRVKKYGPVRVEPAQQIEIDAGGDPKAAQGDLSDLLAAAQEMAEAHGAAGFDSSSGAPPTPAGPDPERLVRLERLRASGAIDEAEYMELAAGAPGTAGETAPPQPAGWRSESGSRPPVIAHRVYPGLRTRSSGRQLDYYLPRYRDAVGLRSDDTYGVLPRRTRSTLETRSTEWDDYWIVYRDRPEYAAGREEWARKMDRKGDWPEPIVHAGIAEAPGLTHDPGGAGGKLRIEKQGWPRKGLVKRETGGELGASMRDRLEKWGHDPEDSFGLSPSYTNRSIYFAWRKR